MISLSRSVNSTRSLGEGLEVETITTACRRLIHSAGYFVPRQGGYVGVASISSGHMRNRISSDYLFTYSVYSALIRLSIVWTGVLPAGINPIVIQLAAHDHDWQSVSEDFARQFSPDVINTVLAWRALGQYEHPNTSPQLQRYFGSYEPDPVSC